MNSYVLSMYVKILVNFSPGIDSRDIFSSTILRSEWNNSNKNGVWNTSIAYCSHKWSPRVTIADINWFSYLNQMKNYHTQLTMNLSLKIKMLL